MLLLQTKPDSKLYQVPFRHLAYALPKNFQGEITVATAAGHHHATRYGWDSQIVQ